MRAWCLMPVKSCDGEGIANTLIQVRDEMVGSGQCGASSLPADRTSRGKRSEPGTTLRPFAGTTILGAMLPDVCSLFASPASKDTEIISPLAYGRAFRLQQIFFQGAHSPEGFWYDQDDDEWVALIRGTASLQFEAGTLELNAGERVAHPGAHEASRDCDKSGCHLAGAASSADVAGASGCGPDTDAAFFAQNEDVEACHEGAALQVYRRMRGPTRVYRTRATVGRGLRRASYRVP